MSSIIDRIGSVKERIKQRRQERAANPVAKRHIGLDKRLVFRLCSSRVPSKKQLKYLSRYLSPGEKTVIKVLSAVIALSLVAIGVKYAKNHITTVPAHGGEYVEGTVGTPHFVNPVLVSANDADLDIIKLVFSGLMKTDVDGELVPDLAESYEISEDGMTYAFRLRGDVQWHDGTIFLARDVVFTIEAIKNEAWNSPLHKRFKNALVETPDDSTVVFTLSEPFAPFLSMLTIGIIPEHLWQDIRPENASRAELNVKPMGTGPYMFKNFTMDKKGAIRSYTLVANEKYYSQKPYISSITLRYYQDFAEAAEAYMARKTDSLSFLPLEFREDVEEMQTSNIYTMRLPQYTAIFFNQGKNEFLGSKSIRQALAFAVDRARILRETLGDNGAPVYGPIPPGFTGFHPEIKKYSIDQDAADALLTEAGWDIAAPDNIRTKDLPDPENKDEEIATPLAVTLTTVDTQENMAVAQIVKQNWESIGIKTELEIVPSSKIQQEKIRTHEYEALLYGEILGQDPDPFPFWHSSQAHESGLNLAAFNNRRVDELLEGARSTTDPDERARMYVEFQDLLAEDVPAIFLYSPTYTYAVSGKVKGIETKTIYSPADRFSDISFWYIDIKRVFR